MPSVREFLLPDLGEGLTEAEIVRWLVADGDMVAVDQPVVEVETAKATVELPCPYAGVVTRRYGGEGDVLAVGAPLVAVTVEETAASAGEPRATGSGSVLVGYGTRETPRRRPAPAAVPAVTVPVRPAPVPGSAPAGPAGPVPVVSPLVRQLARRHGLDLRSVPGSGAGGLILRSDVDAAIRRAEREPAGVGAVTAVPGPAHGPHGSDGPEPVRVPLRGRRAAAAAKFSRSRREIPDATCWVEADATALLEARAALARPDGAPIGLLALLARICVAGLARHPQLNASVDTAREEIVRWPATHLGFAAQSARGLTVPVVRDAHLRDTAGLAAELARLTAAARAGTLTPAEVTGGTFTLNNYGVFGVDGSTPILNHPEAAMLGVGRIAEKPWVHEGRLAVRRTVQLSLTFDHRVCDGAEAAGFLRHVADRVERPLRLLEDL
ncbi:dihydrolipoamide acetyltransferase component of pyruvate dehydrogenase complex [Streptomyces hydrogenans]|uniref:Dihydrolipoamide acetyltransferase component of pyruvate dehydrogenase complex n=1 Tax=Streptomyces hydrogenans TaxID=1873719 RepID=A0ABQ3PP66_9ACTN|nr:dihydrolipoamide acetyltransferase family protein [Streptomyces hydrogenans]GHI26813.1 dihydrolipoamide acetyltransferase component of pyruvate dehydrogenase complex [Streptomyces hydrogenans]